MRNCAKCGVRCQPTSHKATCVTCTSVYRRQRYKERRDLERAKVREWQKANTTYRVTAARARRAGINGGVPQAEWQAVLDKYGDACLKCGARPVTRDHQFTTIVRTVQRCQRHKNGGLQVFERGITDAMFIPRWSIVRVNRQQSVAEHSWAVGVYANDIAIYLGLSDKLCLAVNRHALWHDSRDEIFSGDMPGPNKRALLAGHRGNFDAQLDRWAGKVFPALSLREGAMSNERDTEIVHLVVKAADWYEAAVYMATEFQMGNKCTERHIAPNLAGAISTVDKIKEHAKGPPGHLFEELVSMMVKGIDAAMNGQSEGPWITREDESR